TSKAAPLAAWSASSSETRLRKKSGERTSVGLKCRRAKVDLPQPDGPTRTTRQNSGRVIFIGNPTSGPGASVRISGRGGQRREGSTPARIRTRDRPLRRRG